MCRAHVRRHKALPARPACKERVAELGFRGPSAVQHILPLAAAPQSSHQVLTGSHATADMAPACTARCAGRRQRDACGGAPARPSREPTLRRLVQGVEHPELVAVDARLEVQLRAQQDVVLCHVGVDQADLHVRSRRAAFATAAVEQYQASSCARQLPRSSACAITLHLPELAAAPIQQFRANSRASRGSGLAAAVAEHYQAGSHGGQSP